MGETYDPGVEADRLGARVIEWAQPLRCDENGLYLDDFRLIVLRPGLEPIARRSVLAHEVEHARSHDRPTRLTKPRIERLADERAAARLIDDDRLDDLMRTYPRCAARWAVDLQVSPHLLTVHLDATGRMVPNLTDDAIGA
ncbi:ImmA/IrrE family metallo-endopeptidase [Pseudoclavibacter sp. CFCC 11306]|uniref:ImmA/IrrE family metallo-endopeptidase n=1 Tax=Pseudoclavibacter sp. CFCC 11306 TaxID=1564493 RepID=UPI001300F708|nr:ImmA/IrrE family metallo-endopeptidase [Pseudoclavibacter sp. CFCC 11306]KAB1658978.1 ImmA/IrrE family metallo-endopeptidase [Pseudoclavibacter sp. CFCC 11306]